jgi:shikimate dehydrogenase
VAVNLAETFKDAPAGAAKYGVVGWPLSHTLSPAMHNAAIKREGLNAVYRAVPVPPAEWEAFLRQAKELPLSGFNITIPYKERFYRDAAALGPFHEGALSLLGAVNTAYIRKGAWAGGNTDVGGFKDDLFVEGISIDGGVAVVLGGGGAARAALAAFSTGKGPEKVWIINRTRAKAEALAAEFGAHRKGLFCGGGLEDGARACAEASLLVNATSLGLAEGDPSPAEDAWLRPALTVYDMIYHRETALMRAARAKGARAVGGLGMLVRQGARAFEIWFNRRPPIDVMRRAAEEELERRKTT